jgi:diguanylate cyclase (GGDEF)-like protein
VDNKQRFIWGKITKVRPLKAKDRRLTQVPTAGDSLAEREAAVLSGENAALTREDGARLREEAAGLREVATSQREADAGLREENARLREEDASLREEVDDLREEAADLREKALRNQGKDMRTKAAISVRIEDRLREANENLVIATIHAQTMTEAAEHATAQMTFMAEHDVLTGLPNRSMLSDRLAQAITLAQRHRKKVALLYIDLDRFKHINDSLGHAVGDQLLLSVAKRMQACIRHSDTISRQGGDEFVVLLTEVDGFQDATSIAEKLIESIAKPHIVDVHRLHITLSLGISLFPDHCNNAEAMLMNADTAMYQAKKSGRNKYRVFTPDMNVCAIELQSVEQALHRALEKREFVLYYQPKINLETGAVIGAEALLRWKRSVSQLDCPTQFVSIAENCGLILPIGKWVLREACRQTQEWLQAGLDIGHIAVNVSALELHDKNFAPGIRAILTETGLDPHHLELELTESVLMHDTQLATDILKALRDLGVRIAIDDFGTGYSSLGYLQNFPIDTLKIDQSFVRDIDRGAGEAIVSAVIALGMNLNLRVVAEGIETRQQLEFLQSHGCAEGQGYYFAQPVPAEEFAELLRNGSAPATVCTG